MVLTRSAEMASASAERNLAGAACVELVDIDPTSAASYLARVQVDPPPRGWGDLIALLRNEPDSPVAQALTAQLAIHAVRDTCHSEDDIDELLAFDDCTDQIAAQEGIVNHLLDRVVPAAYTRSPGQRLPEYDLAIAEPTLCLLARCMNQDMTRDLQWWRIPAWTSAAPRMICSGIGAGFLVGIALYFVAGRVVRVDHRRHDSAGRSSRNWRHIRYPRSQSQASYVGRTGPAPPDCECLTPPRRHHARAYGRELVRNRRGSGTRAEDRPDYRCCRPGRGSRLMARR